MTTEERENVHTAWKRTLTPRAIEFPYQLQEVSRCEVFLAYPPGQRAFFRSSLSERSRFG